MNMSNAQNISHTSHMYVYISVSLICAAYVSTTVEALSVHTQSEDSVLSSTFGEGFSQTSVVGNSLTPQETEKKLSCNRISILFKVGRH